MDFFEVIKKRRSYRKFRAEEYPSEYVKRALDCAVLAPNSSNTQTWDFYWLQDPEMKSKAAKICMNQSAARTASHLIVVVADPKRWRRSRGPLIEWAKSSKAHPKVVLYYEKLIPFMYTWGFLNTFEVVKWLGAFTYGVFQPTARSVSTRRDLQEVAIKSAALACENFVLAVTAQGGATCMMEGFDEWRMKWLLRLPCSSRVVMVIAVGYGDDAGLWGPQFRISSTEVIHHFGNEGSR